MLEMPEGYTLIERDPFTWYVQKKEPENAIWAYLVNGRGHGRIFRSAERATQYATKHAELQLSFMDIVPGWR